jgi:hypothetical protein
MRVTMKTNITGYRNGEPWPGVGGTIDLPDGEAADMIANGYAKEAIDEEPAERHDTPATDDSGAPAAAHDGGAPDDGSPAAAAADGPAGDDSTAAQPVKRSRKKVAAKRPAAKPAGQSD